MSAVVPRGTVRTATPCPRCGADLNVHPPIDARPAFYACPNCEFAEDVVTATGRPREGWVRVVVRARNVRGPVVDGYDAVCAGCRDAAVRTNSTHGYHVSTQALPLAGLDDRCQWCEPVEVA